MTPPPMDAAWLRDAGAGACAEALQRYLAGEIGPELALMECVLRVGDADAVIAMLRAAAAATADAALRTIASLARDRAPDLERTARVIASGVTKIASDSNDVLGAIRTQFDTAVTLAPEASVALYSLGAAEILERATGEITRWLRAADLLGADRDVLDIGCGIGRIEQATASHVRTIVGIDLSPRMIEEARRRCARLPNVALQVASGRDLDVFAAASFDLVLAIDAFPYVVAAGEPIVAAHFSGAARVLRPAGALAILNYSYRGDLRRDCADVQQHASAHGLAVIVCGARPFGLWDGRAFLLRREW